MRNEKIHIERIKRLLERQQRSVHALRAPVRVLFCHHEDPIPLEALDSQTWREIQVGEIWGGAWSSAWFQVRITVPEELAGHEIGLWFDCDGEACVWKQGRPWQGLTPKVDWYHKAAKYFVPLRKESAKGEIFDLLIEAAANGLFGGGKEEFRLSVCELVSLDEELRQTLTDISLLLDLALALPEGQTRRKRILYGLNRVCDLWSSDRKACKRILDGLLAQPANASALTAYSVGHAHLDLAWLWPLRETKRKGGRSFANALRLIEEYPDYIFGASQAQLYKWMKELYPDLWQEVKTAVEQDRWEVQGAGWVEFDTNLPSGESIIRQLCYGLRYFEEELGQSPKGLWLPDCFGFNANLPQLLKGCGLQWFMTQKLSWNESNLFPHHLFVWEGIDGSQILAHQLPTNDYNFSNNPSSFLQSEARYAQGELCEAFLNLYGIGDGGGGPTREHLEYGLRQRDLEGVPRFRFAKGQDFFDHIKILDKALLPKLFGELYLEFHRGTYTTQALMKKHNRQSERLLSAAEFVAALSGNDYPGELRDIWEDTLLLQFHDIIPGSSIGQVYEDAHAISEANHQRLKDFISSGIKAAVASEEEARQPVYAVLNPCAWSKEAWLEFPLEQLESVAVDGQGRELPALQFPDKLLVKADLAPWSLSQIRWEAGRCNYQVALPTDELLMENEQLKVKLSPRGTIISIILKAEGREMLAGESNLLKLWEDEPNNWGAWDINHFYRDTVPVEASQVRLLEDRSWKAGSHLQRLCFELQIGLSTVVQTYELSDAAFYLRISHAVDWKEHHKMLRAHFYPDVHADQASYEIAMGTLKRSTKPSNSFEEARFEVPAHRWVDLSEASHGCALFNDCKYGHRVVDNEMELNLLRSPADVDPLADIHVHSYSYACYPHAGDLNTSEVVALAHSFNAPPVLVALERAFKAPELDLSGCTSPSVKLETIKPAEDGRGLVLRFYEYRGASAELEFPIPKGYLEPRLCDLRERPLDEAVELRDHHIILRFRPFEIKTLRLDKEKR